MKNLWRKRAFFPWFFLMAFSCVTINIYFPAAAVEKAADEIVEETWGKKGANPQTQEEKPQSRLDPRPTAASLRLGVREADAQEADLDVSTPAIRSLKDAIKERSESLKPYMDKGNVGLSNDGLLVIRATDGLNLKEKASLTRLVEAENKDRDALYLEIAKANELGAERVPDIKSIFARSWIKNAKKGWWVQGPDGQWGQN